MLLISSNLANYQQTLLKSDTEGRLAVGGCKVQERCWCAR